VVTKVGRPTPEFIINQTSTHRKLVWDNDLILYKNIKNSLRYPSLIGGLVKIWSTTSLNFISLHPYIGFTEVDLVKV
jgi:hypothetical protein